jgi:membrane protease YdiL (CAAX protease family)
MYFSSTIFSLMHIGYGDGVLLLNTFIVGLAWSSLYLVTRSIWPLSLSHATIGTLAFSLGVA